MGQLNDMISEQSVHQLWKYDNSC